MTHTFFPSSNPLLPPTPAPGPGEGVSRAVRPPKMAQDGSKRASERSRLKMASKIAQDLKIARHADVAQLTHNMRPRGPSTAPRGYGATGLQLGDSRGDEELPGGPGEDGGWGEILSADRVNVSRKLGGERSYPRTSNGSYVTRSRASGLSGEAEGFLEGGKPEAQGKAMRTSLIASTLNLFPHHRPSGLRPLSSPSWPHPQPPSDDGPDALAQLSIYGSTD